MFAGVYTALVTPFQDDGSIDKAGLKKLVDFQIEGGIGRSPHQVSGQFPFTQRSIYLGQVNIYPPAGAMQLEDGTGNIEIIELQLLEPNIGLRLRFIERAGCLEVCMDAGG